MACNGLVPGKSQSIGSKRNWRTSPIFLPLGKVWPDLENSEAFVISLGWFYFSELSLEISNVSVSNFLAKSRIYSSYILLIFSFFSSFFMVHTVRGGSLEISGWGCAAWTLEPLTYTRATILDKINGKLRPPLPPNKGWENGAFLPSLRKHPFLLALRSWERFA